MIGNNKCTSFVARSTIGQKNYFYQSPIEGDSENK